MCRLWTQPEVHNRSSPSALVTVEHIPSLVNFGEVENVVGFAVEKPGLWTRVRQTCSSNGDMIIQVACKKIKKHLPVILATTLKPKRNLLGNLGSRAVSVYCLNNLKHLKCGGEVSGGPGRLWQSSLPLSLPLPPPLPPAFLFQAREHKHQSWHIIR